jgi:hypothetical protein
MFFPDMLKSDADRRGYAEQCAAFSDYCNDCNKMLSMAWRIVSESGEPAKAEYHSSVLMLTLHVIEQLDGVAILVRQGSSHPCQPLLRSALEAVLGVLYVLEKDTKDRAFAYQLAHAHKKIRFYNRLDPTTPQGQEVRNLLEGDPMEPLFNALPLTNYPKLVANLEGMFRKPDFVHLEAEWQRLKAAHHRKEDPAWYSLFGGPKSVRALSAHLKMLGLYLFLYGMWSENVHGGMAMEALGKKGENVVMRPVRHPELVQSAVQHASSLALMLAKRLVGFYAPARWPELQRYFMAHLHQRSEQLLSGLLLRAPWKDETPGWML